MPFNGVDATGAAVGWDYDTLRLLCDLLNCPSGIPRASLGRARSKRSPAAIMTWRLMGITITSERDRLVDYSDAYMTVRERLAARQDEERFGRSGGLHRWRLHHRRADGHDQLRSRC